ncbi:MAG: hypothetical protein IT437_14500 [Phycisphaerales bacterium]|nr:hypothetical protein [Phycisphaerales bacterium]
MFRPQVVRGAAGAAVLAAGPLAPGSASGQEVFRECATVLTPGEAARALRLQAAGAYTGAAPEAVTRIGLTFHVVRTSAGTGGLEQARLDQAVIDANWGFAAMGVQFCQVGPTRFIDNSAFYSITSTSQANALRLIDVVPGTINCYFVNSAPFCGISSFTFSSVQGIVYNNSCVGLPTNRSTFPHEIGHYFDLFHTHETGMGGPECTNGSNCATAGDLVCDTPADPNVLGQVSNCLWVGSASPPCGGLPYNPPVRNFMSYSDKECRDHYTPGQNARGAATLANLRTELSRTLCAPPCYPDCTSDGALNLSDFGCFTTKFALGDAYADCNQDGARNLSDFGCFQTKFALGCP